MSESIVPTEWREWLEATYAALESLDYFSLLAVDETATRDEIRDAFHVFALRAHPDQHVDDPDAARLAFELFKRGAEAFRVLIDPTQRARYMEALARGETRVALATHHADEEIVPASVRSLVEKARGLLAEGKVQQARMHAQLAQAREPCRAVTVLLEQIESTHAE